MSCLILSYYFVIQYIISLRIIPHKMIPYGMIQSDIIWEYDIISYNFVWLHHITSYHYLILSYYISPRSILVHHIVSFNIILRDITWYHMNASEYTVVSEISCAKISDDAPLDKICLFGCGIRYVQDFSSAGGTRHKKRREK